MFPTWGIERNVLYAPVLRAHKYFVLVQDGESYPVASLQVRGATNRLWNGHLTLATKPCYRHVDIPTASENRNIVRCFYIPATRGES
jgi:hypothetical protein